MKEQITKIYENAENFSFEEFRGEWTITVPKAEISDFLNAMKTQLDFNFLADLTAIDYQNDAELAKERFAVVYHLLSLKTTERLVVKCWLAENDAKIDTVVPIYNAANWQEREVFDLFGIEFIGHPDLRRILNPDSFEHFPLRKDYPTKGVGERSKFPVIERKIGSKFKR